MTIQVKQSDWDAIMMSRTGNGIADLIPGFLVDMIRKGYEIVIVDDSIPIAT